MCVRATVFLSSCIGPIFLMGKLERDAPQTPEEMKCVRLNETILSVSSTSQSAFPMLSLGSSDATILNVGLLKYSRAAR